MRSFVALVSTIAFVEAQRTTTNNCLLEEGAINVGDCSDLFYKICNKYKIAALDTCNIETYGNASIEWFANDVSAIYWPYINKMVDLNAAPAADPTADPNDWAAYNNWRLMSEKDPNANKRKPAAAGENWQTVCVQDTEIPVTMKSGKDL